MTNHVRKQRGARREGADTLRIREFLKMNPPCFIGSNTIEDSENFIEELMKVYEVMHVFDVERFELAAYQLKGVARSSFDQRKDGRIEDAPHPSWACFEEAFLRRFFPHELKEEKVRELFTLK